MIKRLLGLFLVLVTLLSFGFETASALTAADRKQLYRPFYDGDSCGPGGNARASSNIAYVIGDSLTVAMTSDALGTQSLSALLSDNGWSPRVNAQGSRPLDFAEKPADTTVTSAFEEFENDKNTIANAGVIIIALGTNSGNSTPEQFREQVGRYIEQVRNENKSIGNKIYWVNLHTLSGGVNPRSEIIDEIMESEKLQVIDYHTEAANNPATYPYQSDGVHNTTTGYINKASFIARTVGDRSVWAGTSSPELVGNSGTVGDISQDGNPFHILTYPPITEEVGAAESINNYIQEGWPDSPFVGLGEDFIIGGKESNVNPFLAAAHLQRENGFATASSGWHTTTPPSYNAFGRSASESQPHTIYTTSSGRQRRVFQWTSWRASLNSTEDTWFKFIRRAYLNPGSPYESPDFATYMSHYAPNSDGNNESAYIQGIFDTIDALSGTTSTAYTSLGQGCGSLGSSGNASQYISDCGANGGNAAIACTAINQLTGIPYDVARRAAPDDPSPEFLDCSALTSMALYRTFRTNVGGICSTDYLSNENFERIDIHDIQPGDFIGKGTGCATGGGGGHIAIVVSYDAAARKLITVESSSRDHPSGLRGIGGPHGYNVGLEADGNGTYTWAVRYIGPKTLQTAAL